ncbi:zinc-finger domain-containing protein [Flavobacterium sp.]
MTKKINYENYIFKTYCNGCFIKRHARANILQE